MKRIFLVLAVLLFSYTAHADLESWMGIPISDLETIAGVPVTDLESWAGQTIPSGGSFTATYRSVSTQIGEGTDTLVCDAPAGLISGDMIIAFTGQENNIVVTPPSGFTQIDEAIASGDIKSWYKEAGGSEPSTYTWTLASSQSGSNVAMLAVQKDGGSWVTPTTANYHNDSADSTDTLVSGAVDTQDNSTLLTGWYNDNNYGTTTPPQGTQASATGAGTCKLWTYYENITTGASSVTRTYVFSGSGNCASASVVLEAQ